MLIFFLSSYPIVLSSPVNNLTIPNTHWFIPINTFLVYNSDFTNLLTLLKYSVPILSYNNNDNNKENYAQKRMHFTFTKGTEEIRGDSNRLLWMKKGYLKKKTERLIMVAKDQSLQGR